MTSGLALALGAMLCFGIGDLVYKRAAAAGVAAHRFMLIQSCCYGLLVLAYGLGTRTLVFDQASLWGAVAGIFAYTGYYNFARSLRLGNVSINAPIFRLSFTVTAMLAILLLGERLTAPKVFGLLLALGAVWLLLGASAGGTALEPRAMRVALVRVLVATVAVGIANLLYKVGLRAGGTPAGLLVVQAVMVISLATIMVAFLDRGVRFRGVEFRYATMTAMLLACGFVLLMESLARGEASVLVPVAQMGFVVAAVVGFAFLREPFTPRKGGGLALALGALASFAAA